MDLDPEQVAGLEKQLQKPELELVEQQGQKKDLRKGQVRRQRWKKVPLQVSQRADIIKVV